ncbi:CBS domain-containing protein [Euzebya tangerina]|uniref:CBS domain-containing protein n=1 Tax=Euzebya tangerina TaxID=591198 RepID=UPI00196AA433|nr:CBS domain-containing protein [Euzebya tangerina]
MAQTVQSIMNTKGDGVVTITPAATLGKAAALLAEHNIGAVVVSRDGDSVDGILSERDIVRRFARDEGVATASVSVAETMTKDVHTTGPDASVESLMQTMTNHRIRHVPVIKGGMLVGIVSIGDVVKNRIGALELEAESLKEYVAGNTY